MKIGILHYSLPPVVGGVEAVIEAHTRLLLEAGYQVKLIAGVGERDTLSDGSELVIIPEMNSRFPAIVEASQQLEQGQIPADFVALAKHLEGSLQPALQDLDHLVIHNVFTKHFNLPLTAALFSLLDKGLIKGCVAWCHDFTWTSSHSRQMVHDGYPWDLLRTQRQDTMYVTVSQHRQSELAVLFGCPLDQIKVIYDGVDPSDIYGLSDEGSALIDRLDLDQADLILLMPVRITQAKNIEYALQVTRSLKNTGIHPKLVITGPPDPHDPADMEYYQSLLALREKLSVQQEARFVYESGPKAGTGYEIGLTVVMQLYRYCDALFMPSHREGFGMPILEAGLVGMPIFSAGIPAAEEIARGDVIHIAPGDPAEKTADLIINWSNDSSTYKLRKRIRLELTWKSIFKHQIGPLLIGGHAG